MVLPPITTLIAVTVVVLSSAAMLVVGAVFKWDVASPRHAMWMRVIGVVTVLALAADAAWGRRGEPAVAAAIVAGGIALAIAFAWAHLSLTRKVARPSADGE